ncbi:MAG: hypothetical protein Q8K92_04125 [Leadbetterella sp.]|nr:hypothetical protein [Leadbetterella sp.]
MILSQFQFNILKDSGTIINGYKGGLVLAPGHDRQGAGMIIQSGDEFKITGQIEGWEFIVNHLATERYMKRLDEINNELKESYVKFDGFEIPVGTITIDLMPTPGNFLQRMKHVFLGEHPVYIINKHSTQKYIEELNEINSYRQDSL